MAVRITSSAQAYTRTISLGSQTAWSVTCWAKLSVDTGAQTTLWVIDNGTGDYVGIRSDATGTLMRVISDFGAHGSRELAVGTWYFVAYSLGPSGGRLVTCESDGAFTTTTNGTPLTTTATTLRIGKWPTNGDVLNGCVAGLKFWTATLSQAELEAEAFQYLPARTANLRSWYPFLAAGTTDYSGNAATLSGGTGATTEDGPPIRWGASQRRIFLPDAVTPKSLADSGSASDSLGVGATVALADSGSAVDGLSVEVPVALADAGTAVEALSASATVSLADAATGADLLSTGTPKPVADAGSATDAISASAAVPLPETGSAVDVLSASVTVALADAGAASDAMTSGELAVKALADSGIASDALTVEKNHQNTGAGSPYTAWAAGVPEMRWVAGTPYSPWAASGPSTDWAAGPPSTRYSAGLPALEEV